MSTWVKAFIVLVLICTVMPASAGSRANRDNSAFSPEQLVSFAKQVEKAAAAHGARVFLLARQGVPSQDLPKGIEFTHVGIAVYSQITLDDGSTMPGYAIYNLYIDEQDESRSELVTDFPADFFAGSTVLKAGVAIPTPKLQKRLLDIINSDTYTKLHNPNYSSLANPFDSRYQNCTEFVLDVINSSIYQTDDKAQLKANAKAWFVPQPVRMSRIKLRLGAMFRDELTLADHKGQVKTTTFHSLKKYLEGYGLLQHHEVLEAL